jgi:outer membrane protein TolC
MPSLLLCAVTLAQAAPPPLLIPFAAVSSSSLDVSRSLVLDEAVRIGLAFNRSIQAAYLGRDTQAFDLYVAEGKFIPKTTISASYKTLSGSAGRTRQMDGGITSSLALPTGGTLSLSTARALLPEQGLRTVSSSLILTQPLLKNAGLAMAMSSITQARLADAASRIGLQNVIAQTVAQIIYAYRNLLRAQEQIKIARDGLGRANRFVAMNQALAQAGRIPSMDVIQAEADVANQALALEESVNQLDSYRLELLSLLSLDLDSQVSAVADTWGMDASPIMPEQVAGLIAQHPDYWAAQLALERARQRLRVANNQQLWDVSLVAGVNQNTPGNSPTEARKTDKYLGAQLSIPLFDRSIEQARVSAENDLKNEKIQLEQVRQSLSSKMINAIRNVQARAKQAALADKAAALARQKMDIEQEKLRYGRSSSFQVILFENDLRAAENNRLNARMNYLNTQVELLLATGTLVDQWNLRLISQAEIRALLEGQGDEID